MTTTPTTRSDFEHTASGLLSPPLPHQVASTAVIDVPATSADRAAPQSTADIAPPLLRHERPWSAWRVRLTFLAAFVLLLVPIYLVLSEFWRHSQPVHGPGGEAVAIVSYIWVLLAIPIFLNVVGALTFRNAGPDFDGTGPIATLVCFRIVTRGTNVEAVLKTVQSVQEEMSRLPLFPYCVELVTDQVVPVADGGVVATILVPDEYRTPSGAKFKARALHYALETSPIPDSAWLFHLDEETHLTPSVVRGIRNAILEEETTGALRIGQGVVLYHRDLAEHPFLTLADSVRTGDDLGRFRLQHLFGQTAFGMHGSFILVRNDVEKEVGFDLGPAGSVTEDAWWSLVEMALGRRSRWVDGYCVEQSTRSASDFIRQRRRWFVGLCLVCRRAPARGWHKVALVSSVMLWGVSWLGWWSISIAAMIVNVRIPTAVFLIGILSLSAYSALYLLGLELNLDQRDVSWARRVPWHLGQIVLLPFFSVLESSAVALGVFHPKRDFHVVKK